jgi:hypothetical protein
VAALRPAAASRPEGDFIDAWCGRRRRRHVRVRPHHR